MTRSKTMVTIATFAGLLWSARARSEVRRFDPAQRYSPKRCLRRRDSRSTGDGQHEKPQQAFSRRVVGQIWGQLLHVRGVPVKGRPRKK